MRNEEDNAKPAKWKLPKFYNAEAYYKTQDGISIMPCTIRQAYESLASGHLTSDTQFSIRKSDGEQGEWTKLEDLIARNGKQMPFTEWSNSEEERKEQEDTLDGLNEVMDGLRDRQRRLLRVLSDLQERHFNTRQEIRRLQAKYPPEEQKQTPFNKPVAVVSGTKKESSRPSPPPGLSRTNSSSSGGITVVSGVEPIEYPQIVPKRGVDPFALLKSCINADKKMTGDVVYFFQQLHIKFNGCDKKRLVQQTRDLIGMGIPRYCLLCKVKIQSSSNLIDHICSGKHVMAMKSIVCEDAFKFWWNACDTAAEPATPQPDFVERLGLGVAAGPPPGFGPTVSRTVNGLSQKPSSSNQEPPKRSAQGDDAVLPRNDVPGMAILRRVLPNEKPCTSPKYEMNRLFKAGKVCDTRVIDNDPELLPLFVKPLRCMICDKGKIDKASNMISHVIGGGHMELLENEGFPVTQEAIDFWIRAVQRSAISRTIKN